MTTNEGAAREGGSPHGGGMQRTFQRTAIAIHEAAHAVAGLAVGAGELLEVSLVPAGSALAFVRFSPIQHSPRGRLAYAVMNAAGSAGELVCLGHRYGGTELDEANLAEALAPWGQAPAVRAAVDRAALALVTEHRATICVLASRVTVHEVMPGAVAEIVVRSCIALPCAFALRELDELERSLRAAA